MEDLREVGKQVIDTIKNTKPADAGDLVLGIGNLIEELRHTPESLHAKLDHLEGLFRELTYGEPCGMREEVVEEDDPWTQTFGGVGAVSGVMSVPMQIPVSGAFSMSSSVPTPATPQALPRGAQPNYPVSFEDDDDYDDPPDPPKLPDNEYPPYYTSVEEEPDPDPEPKPFKKRWWNKQDAPEDDNG